MVVGTRLGLAVRRVCVYVCVCVHAEGPLFYFISALLSLQKLCSVWTLSHCDFTPHN